MPIIAVSAVSQRPDNKDSWTDRPVNEGFQAVALEEHVFADFNFVSVAGRQFEFGEGVTSLESVVSYGFDIVR